MITTEAHKKILCLFQQLYSSVGAKVKHREKNLFSFQRFPIWKKMFGKNIELNCSHRTIQYESVVMMRALHMCIFLDVNKKRYKWNLKPSTNRRQMFVGFKYRIAPTFVTLCWAWSFQWNDWFTFFTSVKKHIFMFDYIINLNCPWFWHSSILIMKK